MFGVQKFQVVVGSIEAFDAGEFGEATERAQANHLEAEVRVNAAYKRVLQMQRCQQRRIDFHFQTEADRFCTSCYRLSFHPLLSSVATAFAATKRARCSFGGSSATSGRLNPPHRWTLVLKTCTYVAWWPRNICTLGQEIQICLEEGLEERWRVWFRFLFMHHRISVVKNVERTPHRCFQL